LFVAFEGLDETGDTIGTSTLAIVDWQGAESKWYSRTRWAERHWHHCMASTARSGARLYRRTKCKGLRCIKVQAMPSDNYFQSHSYKLSPERYLETVDWDAGLMPDIINAMICCRTMAWQFQPRQSKCEVMRSRGNRHVARRRSIDGANHGYYWSIKHARLWTWRFWKPDWTLHQASINLSYVLWILLQILNQKTRSIWNFMAIWITPGTMLLYSDVDIFSSQNSSVYIYFLILSAEWHLDIEGSFLFLWLLSQSLILFTIVVSPEISTSNISPTLHRLIISFDYS
jgi:hypothetical protein